MVGSQASSAISDYDPYRNGGISIHVGSEIGVFFQAAKQVSALFK
jgi:hypothetical protein